MKNFIKCLLQVKTIITLAATFVFVFLAIKNQIPTETITMIVGMVFTYYFNKKEDDHNGSV